MDGAAQAAQSMV